MFDYLFLVNYGLKLHKIEFIPFHNLCVFLCGFGGGMSIYSNKNYHYSEQLIFQTKTFRGRGADGPTVYFICAPPLKI